MLMRYLNFLGKLSGKHGVCVMRLSGEVQAKSWLHGYSSFSYFIPTWCWFSLEHFCISQVMETPPSLRTQRCPSRQSVAAQQEASNAAFSPVWAVHAVDSPCCT
jgi:hypothetical protein